MKDVVDIFQSRDLEIRLRQIHPVKMNPGSIQPLEVGGLPHQPMDRTAGVQKLVDKVTADETIGAGNQRRGTVKMR